MTIPGLPDPGAPLAEVARLCLSAAIARFVIHFEPGANRIDTEEGRVDATLRGSPAAVAGTLAGREETAAILGDPALLWDFRDSFRPRLDMPGMFAFEDLDALTAPDVDGQVAYPTTVGERVSVLDRTRRVRLGDFVRLGARAAESALQGLADAVGNRRDR